MIFLEARYGWHRRIARFNKCGGDHCHASCLQFAQVVFVQIPTHQRGPVVELSAIGRVLHPFEKLG